MLFSQVILKEMSSKGPMRQRISSFPSREETEGIVVLEALASQQQVLVRDIPVYQGWLVANENCYMGHSIEEFKNILKAY